MWHKYTTTGVYPDLDRFNRVTASRWTADLATDQDFYSYTVTYDRDSNITRLDDNVYGGTDVAFTMDNLNRLTDSQEGTWNGSSITSKTRQETWTLEQTGNWALDKVDLNGDNDYVDTGELNDRRTHNEVNELTARDTDDNGTNNYTLTFDADGNLTDDGASYKYVYDPFGRLRKVKNQSNTLVGEYWYNGLGWRIIMQNDTDSNGYVDSSDKKYHLAYDENWRIAWVYRESDTNPKERFVYHAPGLGGISASDNLILRDRDENSGWTSAGDGTLEQRRYMLANWRGDVVAIVKDNRELVETAAYSAYGVPLGRPGGESTEDFALSTADETQIQNWINNIQYVVRGDVNLDGLLDSNDKSIVASGRGVTMGRGVLSNIGSRRGYGAYERDATLGALSHVRNRVYNTTLGRWTARDPSTYVDGSNLYAYARDTPVSFVDQDGLASWIPAQPSPNRKYNCGGALCAAGVTIGPPWCPGGTIHMIGEIEISGSCQCCLGGQTSFQKHFWELFMPPQQGHPEGSQQVLTVATPVHILQSLTVDCVMGNITMTVVATKIFCGQLNPADHWHPPPGPPPAPGLPIGSCCGSSIETHPNDYSEAKPLLWDTGALQSFSNIHRLHSDWGCCPACGGDCETGCSTTAASCSPGPEPRNCID